MHLLEDIRAYKKNDPAARSAIEVMLLYNGLHATIDYRIALCFAAAWLFFILVTKYMAMGAILGVWIVPLVSRYFQPEITILPTYTIAIGWILVFFHRKNFKRIRNRAEPKVTFKLHEKEEKYE